MPIDVPLLHRIVLTILGFLFLHMKFSIVLQGLWRIVLAFWKELHRICRLLLVRLPFLLLILPIHEHGRSIHFLPSSFSFFLQRLKVLVILVFHLFGKNNLKLFGFGDYCEGWYFFDFFLNSLLSVYMRLLMFLS